jgi:hypothetical protein
VSEAERVLSELAKNGYIDVRVREEGWGTLSGSTTGAYRKDDTSKTLHL